VNQISLLPTESWINLNTKKYINSAKVLTLRFWTSAHPAYPTVCAAVHFPPPKIQYTYPEYYINILPELCIHGYRLWAYGALL